ncbi:MAG: alpha/beta fold hydrolase [Polyangiales bacterium]
MLAHSLVTAKSAHPDRIMLFLHGILGSRANWRGIARRFVEARTDWAAALVDLREHGDSLGLEGPHSLEAAVEDLESLERTLPLPTGGALGHSFGGKLTLEWLRSRQRPTEAWVIDASPSPGAADPDSSATAVVLSTLAELPRAWPSREAFVEALVKAGQPQAIAQWLAKNLRRTEDGGRRFGPDLGVIRELIEDYARTDSWDVIESLREDCTLDLIIGGRSTAVSGADRERLARVSRSISSVSAHLIEDAGHWVHVDAPDALLSLITADRAAVSGRI